MPKSPGPIYSTFAIHPGETLREELEARGKTQVELAELTGRPRQVISEICTGRRGITAETAIDLEGALGVSADFWFGLQQDFEMTRARQSRSQSASKRR